MSDNVKTLLYVGVAGLAVIVAVVTRPPSLTGGDEREIGEKLFAISDPSAAKSLEIVQYNENKQEVERLEIADKAGKWVIASHKDYPADADDASERIRDAAINLQDLEILGVATDLTSEHEKFEVIEPTDDVIKEGDSGVGELVTLSDAQGGRLARLIIGGEVHGADGQRFVRRPGQNRVYVVRLDPTKLSTKFKDWIKPDLLQITQSDIAKVVLKDYSVEQAHGIVGGRIVPIVDLKQRFEVAVNWNDKDWKWTLGHFREGRGRQLVDANLTETEELNTQKLDDLKSALDELEIVDVESKPQGLTAKLEADEDLLKDDKTLQSLATKGYLPVQQGDSVVLLSNDGEVLVENKEGVEYVLRFGRVAGVAAEEDSTKLNRYLLVTARFNSDAIDPPQLQPLPTAAEKTQSKEADSKKDPKNENEKSPPANADKDGKENNKNSKPNGADESSEDAKKQETNDQADQVDQAEKADQTTEKKPEAKDSAKTKEDENAALEKERERIRSENKKKQEEYDEKINEGKKKVRELNERFGPWYYIISEDTYRKIHLSRFDLVKVKEEGSITVDAFRKLESEGLKKN